MMFVVALVFAPGGGQIKASGHETLYTVYYTCQVSPAPDPDEIVGEWNVDCNGVTSGWGMQPYEYCTRTVVDIGAFCD